MVVIARFNPNGITPIIFAWSGDSDSLAYHMVNRGTADAETLEISNEGGSSPDTSLVFAEAQLNDNFAVKWAHVGEDEIIIKLALQMDAWMGIGLEPEDGGMTNCDIYIGTFDGGTVQVGDYWATGGKQTARLVSFLMCVKLLEEFLFCSTRVYAAQWR